MERPDTPWHCPPGQVCAARHIVPMLLRECGEVFSKPLTVFQTFGTVRNISNLHILRECFLGRFSLLNLCATNLFGHGFDGLHGQTRIFKRFFRARSVREIRAVRVQKRL